MIEVPTQLQIVAFGDLSAVRPDSERIRYYMDAFHDLELVPSVIQEPPSLIGESGMRLTFGSQTAKFLFRSSDNYWSVVFSNSRIDIVCQKANLDGKELPSMQDFVSQGLKILSSIDERESISYSRLSLVTRHSRVDFGEQEIELGFKKRFSGSDFYGNYPPHEWQMRLSTRCPLTSLTDEEANVITALTRAKLITKAGPIQETTEGVEVVFDINTIQEKTDARFSLDDISKFLTNASELEGKLRSEFTT